MLLPHVSNTYLTDGKNREKYFQRKLTMHCEDKISNMKLIEL